MSGAADTSSAHRPAWRWPSSALMMAHQVAGKASRDAIFLSQFRTADLPAMVTVGGNRCYRGKHRGQPHAGPVRSATGSSGGLRLERLASTWRVAAARLQRAHRERASSMFTSSRSGRC